MGRADRREQPRAAAAAAALWGLARGPACQGCRPGHARTRTQGPGGAPHPRAHAPCTEQRPRAGAVNQRPARRCARAAPELRLAARATSTCGRVSSCRRRAAGSEAWGGGGGARRRAASGGSVGGGARREGRPRHGGACRRPRRPRVSCPARRGGLPGGCPGLRPHHRHGGRPGLRRPPAALPAHQRPLQGAGRSPRGGAGGGTGPARRTEGGRAQHCTGACPKPPSSADRRWCGAGVSGCWARRPSRKKLIGPARRSASACARPCRRAWGVPQADRWPAEQRVQCFTAGWCGVGHAHSLPLLPLQAQVLHQQKGCEQG